MSEAASRALIDELTEAAIQPKHIYVHAWQPGDVVFWDNRCLLHAGAAMTPTASAANAPDPGQRNVLDIGGGGLAVDHSHHVNPLVEDGQDRARLF